MERNLEIFWFVDALGWEVVEQSDFLRDLLPFRRRSGMQFGYSSAAIPTILSGKTPAVHGHLGLFRFAPEASPFRWLGRLAPVLKPAGVWNRGRVRHWLSRGVKAVHGFTGYFSLYQVPFERLPYLDYCEKQDLFVPGGMGELANLADILSQYGCRYHISNWRLGDRRNLLEARGAIARGDDFLFLYTAELDGLLHQFPEPTAPQVQAKLAWYRQELEAILQVCREHGRSPHVTIFSDHGMTPLRQTVDVKTAVEATGLRFGSDYGACYDSTMFRVNFLKPGVEDVIRKVLLPFEEFGHWLTAVEEQRHGIYRADRLFGDAIFLANPGVQIVPSDMGLKPLPGMHGYAPEDKDSYAAILSNAEIPPEVRQVSDYFAWMTQAGTLNASGVS